MTTMYTTSPAAELAVIGAGAAGLAAAIFAARAGGRVTLFERNDRAGRKLRITGKGRCNVTNDCELNEFLQNVPTNPRFLYSALSRLSPADTTELFEELGVPLKTERGRRVFPQSDSAHDIADALVRECRRLGVKTLHERAERLLVNDGRVTGVVTEAGEREFAAVIVATGGLSYPRTGSDGDGYRMARETGHRVTDLRPSLVPIVAGGICTECQGLSLKNVTLTVTDNAKGKTVYTDFGELMFAHFGLTGPLVLSASAHIPDLAPNRYTARIDLKPALDEKTLDARILSDFSKNLNRDFCNALSALLPQKLIDPVVRLSGIDPRKKVNEITKAERASLVSLLKGVEIPLLRFRPIDEAIITKGGVDVKEIDPKTMMSKRVEGLYFAGEVLDLDAYTGGYNLQIAFSTGALAGENAAWLTQ